MKGGATIVLRLMDDKHLVGTIEHSVPDQRAPYPLRFKKAD